MPNARYRLQGRIGKGGMGEVFLAYDRLTAQQVALKRVRVALPLHREAPTPDPVDSTAWAGLALAQTAARPPTPPAAATFAHAVTALAGSHSAVATSDTVAAGSDLAAAISNTVAAGSDTAAATSDTVAAGAGNLGSNPELHALRVHLTQEFRTLASLRHPHIVSVLDYGFDRERQPYFTMELLDGTAPLDVAARTLPRVAKVGLVLQILQALTYLHRRGILHRDLKPGNVLIQTGPGGLRVKLLDFGLARLRAGQDATRAEIAGTLGYIAPEVLLGEEPTEAADLFAVGVIIHELVLGVHPVAGRDAQSQLSAIFKRDSLFSSSPAVDRKLAAVLHRALSVSPKGRYPSADVFAQELADAVELPLPSETYEIRDSFLQAAAFVARDRELSTLGEALQHASFGQGSLWLLGGESGVGKSRLVDELRTLALVRGTRVVRGQAVSAGGATYQLFHNVLRPLCLEAPVSDFDAAVLRTAVPDIVSLLERPIPDAAELDPKTAQARFFLCVEKLFSNQPEPLLVLLEDLHWAEPASLALLAHLLRSVPSRPLLIVATYRHDERPNLPTELPGAHSLILRRFSESETQTLSTSMLGAAGSRPEVIDLLAKETEGNAFFIVEVIRTLADELGELGRIGSARIPERVVAGGVNAVLSRRLGRVAREARAVLCTAAVLGRELDLAVLQALPDAQGGRIESALAEGAAAAVIEVSENRWRFAHDKLRDALLAELPEGERGRLHLDLGGAIERAYAADLGPHVAAIAHHLDAGGAKRRAAQYRLAAGERAIRAGATQEALTQLERVRELFAGGDSSQEDRVRALGLLSRAYHGAGRAEECVRNLEQIYAEAGFAIASEPIDLGAQMARLSAAHVRYRWGGRASPRRPSASEAALLNELCNSFIAVGELISMLRPPGQTLCFVLAYVAVAEQLGDPIHLAPAYASLAFVVLATPLSFLSDGYLKQAEQLLGQAKDPPVAARTFVKLIENSKSMMRCEWDATIARLTEELAERQRAGDWRQELFGYLIGSSVEFSRGDMTALLRYLDRMEELSQRVGSAQYVGWTFSSRCGLAVRAGDLPRATVLLEQAERYLAQAEDKTASIHLAGQYVLCMSRQGRIAEARARADSTLDLLLRAPPLGYGYLEGMANLIEFYVGEYGSTKNEKDKADYNKRITQGLMLIRTYAVLYPIGRPAALLWHGRYAVARGQVRLGTWILQRAVASATTRGMPFIEGLARTSLAELAGRAGDQPAFVAHQSRARAIFVKFGALWNVAIVDQLSRPSA